MILRTLLLVGIGGFLGAVARYLVTGWVQNLMPQSSFPWGTMTVNLAGSLIIGFLAGLADNSELLRPEFRLLVMIGLLGSFTTFSTFSLETLAMLRDQQVFSALLNIGLHLLPGLVLVWIGYAVSQQL